MTKIKTRNNGKQDKAKSILNKISTAVVGVVFIIVMAAFVYLLTQVAGGKGASLFGYKFYYILTDSMTPDLQVNDMILSRSLDKEGVYNLKEGDVVTFVVEYGDLKGMTITHRVVGEAHYDTLYGRDVINTQGTKQGATLDPPVPVENVKAKMVKKVAFIGDIYKFITGTTGLIILIVVPFGSILVVLVLRLIGIIRNKPVAGSGKEEQQAAAEREAEIKRKAVEEYIKRQAVEEYRSKIMAKNGDEEEQNKD